MIPISEICSDCRNGYHDLPHIDPCQCACHSSSFPYALLTDGTAGASPTSTGEAPELSDDARTQVALDEIERRLAALDALPTRAAHWKRVALLFGGLWAGTLLAWWVWAVWR